MIPSFIKPSDTIAVTAPSHPIDRQDDRIRFMHGAELLKQRGYNVVFTANVFNDPDRYGRSSSPEEKAAELNALIADDKITAIFSASGGDFLAEMLPYVDIDNFKKHPKWIQGYSDNTSLLYYLSTKADIATAYGANFGDFGMDPWQLSVSRGLSILEGSCSVQENFDSYQNGFLSRQNPFDGYSADEKVQWKCLRASEKDGSVKMTGRLLGGCMDVLLNIAGTPYDGTTEYIESYKEDGIIWYLESFDLHFEQMMEGLWKMKEMGWFKTARGFIFGRPLFYPETAFDGSPLPSYEEVLLERLAELDLPIITGADIGHKGPQFVMINTALAHVECSNGKAWAETLWNL